MDILEQIIFFIDKLCYHKYIYRLWGCFFILSNLLFIEQYNINSRKSWLIVISLLVIFLGLLLMIVNKRKFPKFKNSEYGIIFSIDMEDEKQLSIIKSKFIKSFQYRLKNEIKNYKVVVLPQFIANKMHEKYIKAEDYDGLCKKTNCKFVIHGRSVSGNEEESISCKLHLDSIIFHNPMPKISHKLLEYEMGVTFRPIRNIEIYKTTETNDFELTAKHLNLAFDYILASTHLFLADFEEAVRIFLNIKKDLPEYNSSAPMIKFIKNVIDDRISFCYIRMANKEISTFYLDDDYNHIICAKKHLDESYKYEKDIYEYKLLIAICLFFEKNPESALKHIEDCNRVNFDYGWKFSKVFLKLYMSDSFTNLMTAYRTYRGIFLKPEHTFEYITNITEFIHRVLEKEPEKKQLNFLLFLIYHYLENKQEEEKHYAEFVAAYPTVITNENFKKALLKIEKDVKENFDEPMKMSA